MKKLKKIIIIFLILITILILAFLGRKLYILDSIYKKNIDLSKIENYSYEIKDVDRVMKKNNILRVDRIKENQIIYIDLNENISYTFFNENMTMDKRDISKDMVSSSLIKFDNSFIEKISYRLKVSLKVEENNYIVEMNEQKFILNKETNLVEKIENEITGEVYIYTNYKLGDDVNDIQMPDVSKYTLNESL